MKRVLLTLLATIGGLAGLFAPARADAPGADTVCLGVREPDLGNAPPQPAGILMREMRGRPG